jgi:hypothetical protein
VRINPTLDEVLNGERGIRKGIELCLQNECLVSGVALMFSAIDALAALTRPVNTKDTSQHVFKDWLDRYLLPSSNLGCTANDLYGARCGVLHTYNPESRAQRKGQARRLIYQWHQGPGAADAYPLPTDALVVEVEALHHAFEEAVRRFLIAVETDPEVASCVEAHLPSLLCYKPWPTIAG